MFILLTLEDKLILNPSELNPNNSFIEKLPHQVQLPSITNQNQPPIESSKIPKPLPYNEVIYRKLRNKYISKILLDQGLVVSIQNYSIKSNLIVEIEGVINIDYECTLLIFKPQIGDILYGTIIESNLSQIIVDCGIIKVKVPSTQLMKPCDFNQEENIWFWNYGESSYYYDIGEKCRLKVIDVRFKTKVDISNIFNHNKKIEKNKNLIEIGEKDINNDEIMSQYIELTKDMIMEIYCNVNEEGLGPLKWWDEQANK